MFTLLSFIAGSLGAVTVLQCGQMAAFYGDYSSSVITHLVGLIASGFVLFAQRKRLPRRLPTAPWMFFGGVVGVATVVLNNMAFGGVGVTAIVGLGLLGQSIASLIVDQFGLLGAKRSPFFKGKLIGLAAVLLGALAMVFPLTGANIGAVLMALTTGFTIVIARTLNGRLTRQYGVMRTTTLNYVTGLTASLTVLLLLGRSEPMVADFQMSSNWFMYFGGAVGVVMTVLLNITVNRVPALKLTLL